MKGASAQSALPVATLTGHIRDLLESNFRGLWVTGELREVKPHHTGHVYMALRDGEARLDAVVWKGKEAFRLETAFPGWNFESINGIAHVGKRIYVTGWGNRRGKDVGYYAILSE